MCKYTSVSDRANQIAESYLNCRQDIERPDWDSIFLEMAFTVAKRSHDAQTKCGAVIVNQDNEIISTGYNGFMRSSCDELLPNLRPLKYPFMIHAEHNAILNCARQGRSTKGSKVYLTGEPCNNCLMLMIQSGVSDVVYAVGKTASQIKMTSGDPDYLATRELILYFNSSEIKLKAKEV